MADYQKAPLTINLNNIRLLLVSMSVAADKQHSLSRHKGKLHKCTSDECVAYWQQICDWNRTLDFRHGTGVGVGI